MTQNQLMCQDFDPQFSCRRFPPSLGPSGERERFNRRVSVVLLQYETRCEAALCLLISSPGQSGLDPVLHTKYTHTHTRTHTALA